MKSIKSTSTLKTLPTSKTITSENQPKFLVIILTENENAEFEQFCLEIYDQTFYLPDQNLAEIEIVDSYEEFLSMEKEQNKEYFILSSDKAIDEIYDVLNARERWVLYDSSKKGTSKNINDLPNVVYRTREIQSLREKLESRKFICKQKLINEKYKEIYEKELKKQEEMERQFKETTKSNHEQEKDTFKQSKSRTEERIENRRLKEEENDNKNIISDQNNNKIIKDQKKIKIIKPKTNSYCHNHNVNLQVKKQSDEFKKSKSNEIIFTLSKTYSDYESDSNLHLVSNLPLMSTNMNNLSSENHNNSNHFQQIKEHKSKRESKTPQEYYLDEAKISEIKNSLYINSSVKKEEEQNELIDNRHFDRKYKHLKTESTQHNESSNEFLYLDSINVNDQNNNDDDYQIQKVVLAKNSQITQNNNTQNKKHKLKFSEHEQLNHHHIPLSKERSSSLNHFINRKSIYDHNLNLNNNITKINKLPKNEIEMKLHRSKSKLKARSLLTAKSLKSKELNSSKENFTEIKKKHEGKVKIMPKRYLPTEKKDDHKKKLRNLNEEMSTIESEEYKKSPFKTHREKIVDNFRSKKSLFFQNSERKIHFSKDYEQSNLKSTPLESKQELSALYLVSHLKSEHFINELESFICCNDSVFRFKTVSQLKNQIKQSENVYELIFVFNEPLFSHEELHELYKLNKSCYFVDIDQSIEGFEVLENKIRIKGLNYFNNAFDSITNERKFRKK